MEYEQWGCPLCGSEGKATTCERHRVCLACAVQWDRQHVLDTRERMHLARGRQRSVGFSTGVRPVYLLEWPTVRSFRG